MKTMINIKIDKEIKEKAQEIAKELGLPLSTLVNAYFKQFVREKEVHFSLGHKIRPEFGKLLKQASEDYKKGENTTGPFKTAKEMDAYLDLA